MAYVIRISIQFLLLLCINRHKYIINLYMSRNLFSRHFALSLHSLWNSWSYPACPGLPPSAFLCSVIVMPSVFGLLAGFLTCVCLIDLDILSQILIHFPHIHPFTSSIDGLTINCTSQYVNYGISKRRVNITH